MDDVTIRMYTGGSDRFLNLYHRSYGVERSTAWFEWKYTDNPFIEDRAIVGAEVDGQLAGAIPAIPVPLATPTGRVTALQPTDIMVDPEHRNDGVFTAMAEWFVDRYASSPYAFLLGYPNEQSLPGWTNTGWEIVDTIPKYTRLQELPVDSTAGAPEPLGRIGRAIGHATISTVNNLARPQTGPPVATVSAESAMAVDWTALEPRTDADRITAARTAAYYEWRTARPDCSYTVYRMRAHEGSAAVLVSTRDDPADSTVRILDILPHHGPTNDQQRHVTTIISAICRDNRGRSTITAPNCLACHLPHPATFNFLRTTEFPLTVVSSPAPLIVRAFGTRNPNSWHVGGLDIRDRGNWNADLIERDMY